MNREDVFVEELNEQEIDAVAGGTPDTEGSGGVRGSHA